jgi:hypothetical protein
VPLDRCLFAAWVSDPAQREPLRRRPRLVSRVRARLPLELQPVRSAGSLLVDRWSSVPAFREWLLDAVLGSAAIDEAMGRRWAAATRRRFLRGDALAEELTLWAAGPVLLSEELEGLARHA